ncbi:ATP-binding protein [Enterococcus mundtii]|uniref:ATP-binding protein n=1 Tax=Enterococcus mundtii TaxID=53346 RepID=UPI000446C296|nr:ATP-binding protein [Enterococcus mundtii]EYT96250.1 histidine kinase [Enterococcus mundtii CRL35]
MGKVIQVPSWFTKDNIDSFLESIINPDLTPVSKQIQFDLTSVRFIDPCGMTTLYNTCLWLENMEEVEATFLLNPLDKLPKYNEKPMMYLVDCGFFKEFFGNKEVYKVPMIRDTTLPVRTLRSEESYEWKETVLKPWLQKSSNKYCEFSNIQTAIDEIFNNIADHSSQNIGCVFAQFFPNLKKIKISISDFGIGIPTSVKKLKPDKNDAELLSIACQEGFSTKSTPRNRGAGLTNIIISLTNLSIGTVHIHSNYGIIEVENKMIVRQEISKSYYPGTLFSIELDLANEELYDFDEEEEFEWF